jgi:hypothetical protein
MEAKGVETTLGVVEGMQFDRPGDRDALSVLAPRAASTARRETPGRRVVPCGSVGSCC